MLSPRFRALQFFALLAGAASVASPAQAQLRLPGLPGGLSSLPQAIGANGLGSLDGVGNERLLRQLQRELPDLRGVHADLAARLLRQHPDVLEADPRGAPAVRHEIIAYAPGAAALAAARAAGLRELRSSADDAALRTVVLGVPDGVDTATMLERLRALDGDGVYDYNHLYFGGGAASTPAAAGVATAAGTGETGRAGAAGGAAVRLGLVDSGVDSSHAAFHGAAVERWGCGGQVHPHLHGTAVAALMVGRAPPFAGGAPGARLYAADIYCDSPSGGSADRIAAALAWLAAQDVAVINLSLVGPPNQGLERLVATLVRRGHLLVAAVGNDGPAAPPLYPASYPGVVGVSAIGRNGQPLPEAARGPQVMFAAPGNNMVSAAVGTPAWRAVRGTSFAAPLVAALLADKLPRPEPGRAAQAVAALAREASHPPGVTVSNEFGYGIVGTALRTDPAAFR